MAQYIATLATYTPVAAAVGLSPDDKVWIAAVAVLGFVIILCYLLGCLCGYGCRECVERSERSARSEHAERTTRYTEYDRRMYTDESRFSSDSEYEGEYESI